MLRLLSDINVPGPVIRGLRRRLPAISLVRTQDVGLDATPDPAVLEWAAAEGRILISRDVQTLINDARGRVGAGLPMPGLFILRDGFTAGELIDALLLLDFCSEQWEWTDQVIWLPL